MIRPKIKRPPFFILAMLILFVLIGIGNAFSAANYVPPTNMDLDTLYPNGNDFKPPECYGIQIEHIVIGADGGSGNDLILGTDGQETLNGKGGDDCILGGDGSDTLKGNDGDDVIISQASWVIISGGSGNDTCYAPNASWLVKLFFIYCETVH